MENPARMLSPASRCRGLPRGHRSHRPSPGVLCSCRLGLQLGKLLPRSSPQNKTFMTLEVPCLGPAAALRGWGCGASPSPSLSQRGGARPEPQLMGDRGGQTVGRAVPNSQGYLGTQRAAAAGRPGQDPLPSCPGSPRLPGDRRWQGLAAIWGSPGMGFGGRGEPCVAVLVGLGAGDVQTPLRVGGGAVIAEGGPGDCAVPSRPRPLHPLVSAGPALPCSVLPPRVPAHPWRFCTGF